MEGKQWASRHVGMVIRSSHQVVCGGSAGACKQQQLAVAAAAAVIQSSWKACLDAPCRDQVVCERLQAKHQHVGHQEDVGHLQRSTRRSS